MSCQKVDDPRQITTEEMEASVAVRAQIEADGETIRSMTFHHLNKFSDRDPANYFGPEIAQLLREYAEIVKQEGIVSARGGDPLEMEEMLQPLVEDDRIDENEVDIIIDYTDDIRDSVNEDPTYASVEARLAAIKQEILDDPTLSDYMRGVLYDMVSAIEGVVLDAVLDIAVAEVAYTGTSAEVSARGLAIDCILGMKPSCWLNAFIKLAISTTAAIASGGVSEALIAGTTITLAKIAADGAEKGVNSFFTALLTGYTNTGAGNKCSCTEAIERDPCEIVQRSFVIDPETINCKNPGELRLKVFGADLVPNVRILWQFDRDRHEQNAYAKIDPLRGRTFETLDPWITVVQMDPDKPVHLSAEIWYTPSDEFADESCRKTALTPYVDDLPGWAWNLYDISDDLGPVLIDGPTSLPVGDNGRYRAYGLFREIPGVSFQGIVPNFAGTIISEVDPYTVNIRWDVATPSATVYATVNNICGTPVPGYRNVTVY